MAWNIPALADLRRTVRDYIVAWLPGSDGAPPNSRMRVLGDAQALLARDQLDFIFWGTEQLLPDTAETEFLDRHATIWIDGRHAATYAIGDANFTGIEGTIVPLSTRLTFEGAEFETTSEIILGTAETAAPIKAITPGTGGNVAAGESLALSSAIAGVDPSAVVVRLEGGVDVESDELLRSRVLARIQQPPRGGAAHDYVAWSREIPGVTRAWASPHEQGVGSVTVRFMMDDLRASNDGFPTEDDCAVVEEHIAALAPITARDIWVTPPVPWPVDFVIHGLVPDTSTVRAAVVDMVGRVIHDRAAPAHTIGGVSVPQQTIHAAWLNEAISAAPGVDWFVPVTVDEVPPSLGHIAVPGTIVFMS